VHAAGHRAKGVPTAPLMPPTCAVDAPPDQELLASACCAGQPVSGGSLMHSLTVCTPRLSLTELEMLLQVAACVCLFSLDKAGAIPVDTHVWQLACRYYAPHLRNKTLNKQVRKCCRPGWLSVMDAAAG
jgi:hypothetical protein